MRRITARRTTPFLLFLLVGLCFRSGIAFQNELFQQALQAAEALKSLDSSFLFAAANLLDSNKSTPPALYYPKRTLPSLRLEVPPLDSLQEITVPATTTLGDLDDDTTETCSLASSLRLTPAEHELFALLRAVRDRYCPTTTLRVAGGWVRDKLLGQTSTDVDVVVDDLTGAEFGRFVVEYLRDRQQSSGDERSVLSSDDCLVSSECSSNNNHHAPHSQHLQTAHLHIQDLDVDVAQLRYERYDNTRQPFLSNGVPTQTGAARAVEDAFRRDLTVNALFYNLHTNQVEDWTEGGLADLRTGRIATPLPALPTLLQDPSRLLRAVRFAARLRFTLAPDLQRAAVDARVRYGVLHGLSSRKRGGEIDALFQTTDPTRGIVLLSETNLLDGIFPLDDEDVLELKNNRLSTRDVYQEGLNTLARGQALANRLSLLSSLETYAVESVPPEQRRRLLWYAAWLDSPCRHCRVPMASPSTATTRHRQQQQSVVYRLLVQGLQRPMSDSQAVERMIAGADALEALLSEHREVLESIFQRQQQQEEVVPRNSSDLDRADLRWKVYQVLKPLGAVWKESLLLVLARQEIQNLSASVQEYHAVVSWIERGLGLHRGVWTHGGHYDRPIWNGSQIQQILPGVVQGPRVRSILQAQKEWQVRHDCTADSVTESQRDQLKQFLRKTFPEYAATQATV